MEQSILKSTKKFVNVALDDDAFDDDILMHVNAAFALLNELGVGPDEGFAIESDVPVWGSFVTDLPQLQRVKQFVYLKTRLSFDLPGPTAHVKAMEEQLLEITHRISMHREGQV